MTNVDVLSHKNVTCCVMFEDSMEVFGNVQDVRQRTKENTISSTMKETAIFELQERDVIQIRLEVVYRNDRGEIF